jgi:hypothetical protein
MLRASLLALTLGASALLAPAAHADRVYWSLGIGGPGVAANFGNVYPVAPPPVYVQPPAYYGPPPVYYAPPAPVYYAPPPQTYVPAYVNGGAYYGVYNRPWRPNRGWHHGWRHHDDDDDR